MIFLNFNIRNPWSNRFEIIKSWHGKLPIEHKYWELQIDRCSDIINLHFRWAIREDHAGLWFSVALFGYDLIFSAYDHRHWDDATKTWSIDA